MNTGTTSVATKIISKSHVTLQRIIFIHGTGFKTCMSLNISVFLTSLFLINTLGCYKTKNIIGCNGHGSWMYMLSPMAFIQVQVLPAATCHRRQEASDELDTTVDFPIYQLIPVCPFKPDTLRKPKCTNVFQILNLAWSHQQSTGQSTHNTHNVPGSNSC